MRRCSRLGCLTQMIAFDRPGYGQSDPHPSRTYATFAGGCLHFVWPHVTATMLHELGGAASPTDDVGAGDDGAVLYASRSLTSRCAVRR